MGLLRSCYSTKARFFYDSPVVNNIIWYWARTGASWFPEGHVFAPLIFQGPTTLQINGVGEQPQYPRPWRDGSIPVASPTGIIDGEIRWFQQGQSVKDPGLDRTFFGIPTNCTAPLFVACGETGLTHGSWQLLTEDMVPFGTSDSLVGGSAFFTTTLFPGLSWSLTCGGLIPVPGYSGQLLEVTTGFFFEAVFYAPVQVDATPTYKWTQFIGTTPPNPVYTRWLPGP
jgi:hypothetical protein